MVCTWGVGPLEVPSEGLTVSADDDVVVSILMTMLAQIGKCALDPSQFGCVVGVARGLQLPEPPDGCPSVIYNHET